MPWLLAACGALRAALAQELNHGWRYRNDDDPDHDPSEIVLDPGDVSEQEARISERGYPGRSTEDVVGKEFPVGHLPHSRKERCKRSHDRHEAPDDDREPAVLFVEAVRPLEILR